MAPVDNDCHPSSFRQIGDTDQKVGSSNPSESTRQPMRAEVDRASLSALSDNGNSSSNVLKDGTSGRAISVRPPFARCRLR